MAQQARYQQSDRDALVPHLRELVEVQHKSTRQAAAELQERWPNLMGLTKSNISRICQEYDIKCRTPVPDATVERCADLLVERVGPTYGQRMMKSLLESAGFRGVAKYRIGAAMKRLYPDHHDQRCTGQGAHFNPQAFHSRYFGETLHMDQNEKLQPYGVCIVQAVDGHSSYVTGFAVMPIKNNLTIYEKVFRPSILEFGVWEQLIVDKGREFYLCQFTQVYLRMKAHEYHLEYGSRSVTRTPYRQVASVREGPTCGQRKMKCLFESAGLKGVSLRRIADAMRRLYPEDSEERANTLEVSMDPGFYRCYFFGDRLYLYENSSLEEYGVCIVQAVDGSSGFVAGFAVMAVENNLAIYDKVFRPSVVRYGIWEQLVVSERKGYDLCCFMQCHLRRKFDLARVACRIVPVISKLWAVAEEKVEQVFKAAMADLVEREVVELLNAHDLFSVSQVSIPLVQFSMHMWVEAWNGHPVRDTSGKQWGRPISHVLYRRTLQVSVEDALVVGAAADYCVRSGRAEEGGFAQRTVVGEDPLSGYPDLQKRRDEEYERELVAAVGPVREICGKLENRDFSVLESAILIHKEKTGDILAGIQ